MKKRVFVAMAMALSVFFIHQQVSAQKPGFRFKVSGGYDTLGIGDPNALIDAPRSFFINLGTSLEDFTYPRTEVVGETKKARKGGEGFGGEVIVTYSRFGFGLGLEHLGSRTMTSDLTLRFPDYPQAMNIISRIDGTFNALALAANIYVFMGLSPLEFCVFAGPGLYFGKTRWNSLFQENLIVSAGHLEEQSIEANAIGVGAQGGLGLGYELTPRVRVFAEGRLRACKLKNWKGDEVFEITRGGTSLVSDAWSGKLWYFESDDVLYGKGLYGHLPGLSSVWYPDADIYGAGDGPSGENVRNARAFAVDLSGFSLRAGISIRF